MKQVLEKYKNELESELRDILLYWMKYAVDETKGGFVGRIDYDNNVDSNAPKGSVLNSRVLWTFSAAYNLTKDENYLMQAKRCFSYLCAHFIDKEHGGVFWSVTCDGDPFDTKKQIYAHAFAIYGLTEFYKASGEGEAKELAIKIYHEIIKHSYDENYGGYFECFSRNWEEIDDVRLSAKDANEKKSMNTHLHVLEAFSSLFSIWQDPGLKKKLLELIQLFQYRIISNNTHHLILFFEDDWQPKSKMISYGHDIEAAWLIQEAAKSLGDKILLLDVKSCSIAVAKAAAKGVDEDGGMWYEYDVSTHHLLKQKHWWPQAEAMVGFFNTWQNTGDKKWLQHSMNSWDFIKKYIKDNNGGEWRWGVNEDYSPMKNEDKVGLWKCPYHNSRACIEIINRISTLLN